MVRNENVYKIVDGIHVNYQNLMQQDQQRCMLTHQGRLQYIHDCLHFIRWNILMQTRLNPTGNLIEEKRNCERPNDLPNVTQTALRYLPQVSKESPF